MEKKKVVYQITRKKYRLIEVDTEEQAELIKELNRDFEREDKREKAYQARYISLDELSEYREFAEDSPSAEEICIEKEQEKSSKELIYKAMKILTERQREVVVKVFWEKKTYREIGEELGIHYTTVAEIYYAGMKKLKKFLLNTPTKRS